MGPARTHASRRDWTRRTLRLLALYSTLIFTACALVFDYVGPNEIGTSMAARRLQYSGFSIEPPLGQDWRLLVSEQTGDHAIFRRKMRESRTHTFYAGADLHALREGLSFEEAAIATLEPRDTARFQLLERQVEAYAGASGPCVRYTLRLADSRAANGGGRTLELVDRGIVCAHPKLRGEAVTVSFSERGLPAELDDRLWDQHAAFLDSLRFEDVATK